METRADVVNNRGWEGLPSFSKDMYKERYFLPDEDYEKWCERMAKFADDKEMSDRIKSYLHNYWFHPSTPVSSNGNVPKRGLPISCYVNEVEDTKEGIFNIFTENNWLGSLGGGIGTLWSKVRSIGEKVGNNGVSSGIIPFLKVSDSSTLAVSQGGLRRASQAAYLDISHPEIEEFIDVRRPTGDQNRRSLNIHHGVVVTDEFMKAVEKASSFNLASPKTGEVIKTVDAFDLFKKILVNRVETGEPYILFKDTVNKLSPIEYKEMGLDVSISNLCSEITLHTEQGYTGVCCLGSLNLEYYDEYKDKLDQIVFDCQRFLDNVLQSFIDLTKNLKGFEAARASAMYERSLGLGVMGFHSLLQKKKIPFSSPMAKSLNKQIFSSIKRAVDKADVISSEYIGSSPLGKEAGTYRRNIHTTSIAPTASISTLCGATSQGVDPRLANAYIHKTNIGTYTVKNKYLDRVIKDYLYSKYQNRDTWKANYEAIWKSIITNEGSVQHLEFLDDYTKDIFKTALEINQASIIDLAADRTPYIDQSQSINIFLPADENVETVFNLHLMAWKRGLKSMYYCRSTAVTRASANNKSRQIIEVDECPTCQ